MRLAGRVGGSQPWQTRTLLTSPGAYWPLPNTPTPPPLQDPRWPPLPGSAPPPSSLRPHPSGQRGELSHRPRIPRPAAHLDPCTLRGVALRPGPGGEGGRRENTHRSTRSCHTWDTWRPWSVRSIGPRPPPALVSAPPPAPALPAPGRPLARRPGRGLWSPPPGTPAAGRMAGGGAPAGVGGAGPGAPYPTVRLASTGITRGFHGNLASSWRADLGGSPVPGPGWLVAGGGARNPGVGDAPPLPASRRRLPLLPRFHSNRLAAQKLEASDSGRGASVLSVVLKEGRARLTSKRRHFQKQPEKPLGGVGAGWGQPGQALRGRRCTCALRVLLLPKCVLGGVGTCEFPWHQVS